MKTGLTKKQKTTAIYFDEDSPIIEVITYNTNLKNRLSSFASQYPKECKLIDDDEQGCKTFESQIAIASCNSFQKGNKSKQNSVGSRKEGRSPEWREPTARSAAGGSG